MADQPVTREKLINADKDVQVIEDFIKKPKDETVITRFGDEIMTLKGLEEEVKKSGGYFKRYATLAAANADIANIPVDAVVKVTSETDGGDYERASAEATSLTKSAYDPLTQAKNHSDSNPLFKPVRLDETSVVGDIVVAGIYHVATNTIASTLGLPSGKSGQLYVSGNTQPPSSGYVFQTYINSDGDSYQRVKTTTWQPWKGYSHAKITTENLNDVTSSGVYGLDSGSHATAEKNYPFPGSGCLVIVESSSSVVRQQVLSLAGMAQRWLSVSTNTWSDWRGVQYPSSGIVSLNNLMTLDMPNGSIVSTIADIGGHVDNAITDAVYHVASGSVATAANGFPITGFGGFLTVKKPNSTTVHQKWDTYNGSAFRWGSISNGVATWQPWRGNENKNNGISELGQAISIGSGALAEKILTTKAQFNDSLDLFIVEGTYLINNSVLAVEGNGFPISGASGFLDVIKNASGAIIQRWSTYSGYAYRWGSLTSGGLPVTWQPWRGFKNTTNAVVDITNTGAVKKKLIIYGSSTMWYLSDEMTDLATRKNLDFKNHGISGDNLGGAGQAQGSNIVTLQFTSGVIPASGLSTPVVESSFGGIPRHNRVVELSNGVKGTLAANGVSFTATTLTSDLTVDPNEKYRVYEYAWYDITDGIYVFNIGKNDVSSSTDNSEWILNNTIKMIDYIPNGSKFIVGGHFSNTGSTDMHRQVVEAVNQSLRLKYGVKYFDINELLFSDATWMELGLTKTQADIEAINNRQLPPSLSRDTAHLSAAMDIVLCRAIENKLTSLGYI